MTKPFGLAIHGGAGVILKENMTSEVEADYRATLKEAVEAGYEALKRGSAAVDAVGAAIRVLEDSPLFNAARGAVLNADGQCELDAAIMDGKTLAAGAVAGLQQIRNPIDLARAVMDRSPHVMLIGEGAERYAKSLGYELVPNSYFQTERSRQILERAKALERAGGGEGAARDLQERIFHPADSGSQGPEIGEKKHGTVGCVALDKQGNLAAGTSTGGLTNKRFGRVGDSPIIGAGTYANNATCAVSCTGQGEYFIRAVVGHEVSVRMLYRFEPLAEAARAALNQAAKLGGEGGLIAIDREGNVAMPFNTPGMYRAWKRSDGRLLVGLYGSDWQAGGSSTFVA
jgi:beta-aspartyl-peptidase (threonine type)